MTTTLNINQSWVDSQTWPYALTGTTIINITENIILDSLSSNHYFTVSNLSNTTINGNAWKVTLQNSVKGMIYAADNGTYTILIQNLGIIQGTNFINEDYSGCFFTPFYNVNNNITIKIYNCYYYGNVIGIASGGFIGSFDFTQSSNVYLKNNYMIGNIIGNNSGGFIGNSCGNNFGMVLIFNCYQIGNVSGNSAGSLLGSGVGINGGNIYLYNNYQSSGNFYGTFDGGTIFLGYYNNYNYSNNWNNTIANSKLNISTVDISTITTSTNWTIIIGTFNQTDLNNMLSTAGITTGDTTMFSFGGIQPYGITSYTVSPYLNYSSATSQAAQCVCKGTKIILEDNTEKEIENIKEGLFIKTPFNNIKKVKNVVRMWCNGMNGKKIIKHFFIPKDYFEKGFPSEDTYLSWRHNLLFTKEEAEKYDLKNGKEFKDNLYLYEVKDFAIEKSYQEVSLIKGEGSPYGFYYYHLIVEDESGFYANGMPSESLRTNKPLEMYEIINKN